MRMWNFYQLIINLIVKDKGILDEFISLACVCLINFMSRSPDQFRSATFEGQGSCLEMLFRLISRIFQIAKAKEDEIEAICSITLVISLLENVPGIEATLPDIVNSFVSELSTAKTPEYKSMLMQGLSMCFWYNAPATLSSLEAMGATTGILTYLF